MNTDKPQTETNTMLAAGRAYTNLNRDQKLLAIKLKYYDGLDWNPKKGDYYTSSRNDLELYQIVDEDEHYFFTNYCNPQQTTPSPAEWSKSDFKKGFGEKRIYVPNWVLLQDIHESIERRAVRYWEGLAKPLADERGLVITAFCIGASIYRNSLIDICENLDEVRKELSRII